MLEIATCAAKRRYSYAYRFKANPVLAEMDIFVTLPDQQWQLVDSLIDYSKTILKQQPGYVGECYSPQLDGMRVTNYVQWQSQSDYET